MGAHDVCAETNLLYKASLKKMNWSTHFGLFPHPALSCVLWKVAQKGTQAMARKRFPKPKEGDQMGDSSEGPL